MSTKDRAITLHPKHGRTAPASHGLLALRAAHQLVPNHNPDHETAKGYLRLTAQILVRSQERPFRTLGVFSAHEGEGRTTAAFNLAICLGRTRGRQGRVLLVDGDARKRAVTKLFCGQQPTADGDTCSASDHAQLVATQFEGVDVLTAPSGSDDLTLHDPAAWRDTFEELSSRYAHIVIDCPPILDAPEGMILRDCVEELVLVVRAGETAAEDVAEVVATLGRRVLGVVLNGGEANGRKKRVSA